MSDPENTYWWCLVHSRVEKWDETDSPDRLGPFPTHEAAQDALKTMAERQAGYDREAEEEDAGN